MSIGEIVGLENITFGEAMALVGLVVLPMIWVGIFNPALLGSTFATFAGLAYLIAVYTSMRRDRTRYA